MCIRSAQFWRNARENEAVAVRPAYMRANETTAAHEDDAAPHNELQIYYSELNISAFYWILCIKAADGFIQN